MEHLEEVKSLFDEGMKLTTALRAEVDELKGKTADVVDTAKLGKIEADLAANIQARQAEGDALKARIEDLETKLNRPGKGGAADELADEHKSAFIDWMRDPRDFDRERKLKELQSKATDVRVATAGSGGYALPEEISRQINKTLYDMSPIRQIAKVVTVGTSDYKELVDRNGFGSEWVGETTSRSQTDTPDIAECAPTFGELAAKPQATTHSLDDLFFDVEAWLLASAREQYAVAEGAAFVSGNGTNKPTGFLAGTPVATADSSRAYGVLQYIATGAAAAFGSNPFDNIIDLQMGLKAGYRANGRFVLNSSTAATLAKVRSTDGQYLWQPAIVAGQPDMLRGRPITYAEDMPDVAANAFAVAFGDFSRGYLIADRVGIRVVRDEVTTPGYVKFIVSKRVGGKLLDSDAIKLLKIAAS